MGRNGVDIRERSIRVTFTFNGKQERRTLQTNGRALLPTPANLKYAERLAAEIKEKIRLGTFSMPEYFSANGDSGESITVERQLNDWLNAQRIEESTKDGYTSACRFWSNGLKNKAIKSLKLSDLLKIIASRPLLSGKTINNYVSVLKEALELAVDDGLIQENPALKIPRAKWQKEPPDPFTNIESDLIIESIKQKYPEQVANFVEFWFWTGMRTSEVFGLSWDNVDLLSSKVLVTEAVVRGIRKRSTKTHTARTVILNSRALSAIQRQRSHTQVAGGSVFQDPRYMTAWVDERAFRRSFWTPTLKLLGIRYRRPYNMRHSYATAMLMVGMNHSFCAKQLGHSVEIFQRTYSKWIDGEQNDMEMAKLEQSINKKIGVTNENSINKIAS